MSDVLRPDFPFRSSQFIDIGGVDLAKEPAIVADLGAERLAREPHRSGNARCLNCKHEWHAVAPSGVTALDCPTCATNQGVFKGLASTSDLKQWECRCGEYTFFIDEHGPYCAHCGIRPELA